MQIRLAGHSSAHVSRWKSLKDDLFRRRRVRVGQDLGRFEQGGSQVARLVGELQAVDFGQDGIGLERRLANKARPECSAMRSRLNASPGSEPETICRAIVFARSNRVSVAALLPMLNKASITMTRCSGVQRAALRHDGLHERFGKGQGREKQEQRPHGQEDELFQPHPPRVLPRRLEQKPHGGPVRFAIGPAVQKVNQDRHRPQHNPHNSHGLAKPKANRPGSANCMKWG